MIETLISSSKKYSWMSSGISDSASVVQKNGIITITDNIKQSQWQEFESALEGNNQQLLIITEGLPIEWVNNKKLNVIQSQNCVRRSLKNLDDILKNHSFNHFNIQINSLQYDYFLMYGRWEFHRETIMSEMESRSILDHSLYSRPTTDNKKGRSIENKEQNKLTYFDDSRSNHKVNFDTVVKNSQKCHCTVVLEDNGLLEESDNTITEKSLWPIFAQVPFIWAMGTNKMRQLARWGFYPADRPTTNLRSLMEQLLWLKTEFSDPTRAQRWQDNQGKAINHNLYQLKILSDRIDDDIHQQLKKLGISDHKSSHPAVS